ncbi:MAG: AAA family ATPase [Desulfobacteraceae bacterium]|nr:MAG: AAA family ATPase [Desulfobacteraceae bacterium]
MRGMEEQRQRCNSGFSPVSFYDLPGNIRELHGIYLANRPRKEDPLEVFQGKQARQDKAVEEILGITASAMEQKGSVTQPAVVTRRLPALFDKSRFEVRPLDRVEAALGRPLFVMADAGLKDEILIGDVVVLTANGGRIIDVDRAMLRSGENATVVAVRPDQDFPFEIELEGDGHLSRRIEALGWERLAPPPGVGDRVKVMGGVIHAFAPKESAGRFKKIPREDLDNSDLHGSVPNRTLELILTKVDRYFHREKYPPRSNRYSDQEAILLYGPPGVGKTWTITVAWSILNRKYNNGKERIVFLGIEGSAIEGSLVGSGPRALRELRGLAKQAVSEGRLPITFINEAGSLLRSREMQGMMLDGGSSLSTHEQFLSMLSGPDEIPGIILVDLNLEKLLDEATRQRFQTVAYPHIDKVTFVERMFKTAYQKESGLFEGSWDEIRRGLMSALNVTIGTVLIGSSSCPVRVGNIISGRLFDKVIQESLGYVDQTIFNAREKGVEPFFSSVTASLLHYTLVRRAWSLFKCWGDKEARERLTNELVRSDKMQSISKPAALPLNEIAMSPEFDCRTVVEEWNGENVQECPMSNVKCTMSK